jgi:hypothetical protein
MTGRSKREKKSVKITTFNPQIITMDAEPILTLFGTLGFEVRHDLKGVGEQNDEGIRMKDANGFYLDIAKTSIPIPHDLEAIRMNVYNFDEAYTLLETHGFKNFYGDRTVGTDSSKSALMISPSGFAINLVEHIKK